MSNNYYSIYLESVFNLANTLVIKFDYTVEAINTYQRLLNPALFNENDPTTWKYYLNVSGEYHYSDTMMTVVSLDTLEEIIFSKENLTVHKATASAYQYGSRYYQELVSKFPTQETLIQGILYPVDIQKAINAKNGEIISYPQFLIESNEYTLISDLQNWIDGYIFRWINDSFGLAHDLYQFTALACFYSKLPQVILDIRQKKCHTNEVHSFHVKQYLASHGQLDRNMDQMTLKQSLWLYRNILYIKKNLGRKKTFDFLTEHIMTQRSIPLSGYTGYHDVSQMPTQIYPQVLFKRQAINEVASVETVDPLPLTNILAKEDSLAKDNYEARINETDSINDEIVNSVSNKVVTKAVESTLFDYSNSSPYNLEDILLNEWIYLAFTNRYTAYIQLTNPVSGENFNISVKDAFILGYYLFCHSFDLIPVNLPEVPAIRVQRVPMATKEDVLSVADRSLIDDQMGIDILQYQPLITNVYSTESFRDLCVQIYDSANYQHNLMAYQEDYYARAIVQGMASRIYSDAVCDFNNPATTYTDWFASKNLPIEDFLLTDSYELWTEITVKATGSESNLTLSLASIQQAMTDIMTKLSSYSIQFINSINKSALRVTEFPTVRTGQTGSILSQIIHVDHEAVNNMLQRAKQKQYILYQLCNCGLRDGLTAKLQGEINFNICVEGMPSNKPYGIIHHVYSSQVSIKPTNLPVVSTPGVLSVPGIDIYLGLSDTDKAGISDMYDNCYIDNQKQY